MATVIADRIGKSFQSVCREIKRNSKPDGSTSHGSRTTRPTFVAVVRSSIGSSPTSGFGLLLLASWSCSGRVR